MAKQKKISGAAICMEKIDNCDDAQVIDIPYLRKGFEDTVSEAAAYNVIWRLRGVKALEAIPGADLESLVNRKKLAKFFDTHTPNSPYFQARNKNKRGGKRKYARTNTAVVKAAKTKAETPEDIDVINNLLDAMAAAEPILNKLKNIYEAVHS